MNITNDDLGKLILRLMVAFLMLFHGWHKVVHGVDYIVGLIASTGLPGFIAYGVYVGEILAPIMLIIGFRVKIAASLIIITMLMGIALISADSIFALTQFGGWKIELNAFHIFSSLAIIFLGAGKYSIEHALNKKSKSN